MVLYWDASAVLAALVQDEHSRRAARYAKKAGLHLLSSLCFAEIHAVIQRMKREAKLSGTVCASLLEVVQTGPWRRISVEPDWEVTQEVASRHALRGADLWHIAAAKTLQRELPELRLLTFDRIMATAARKEHLSV